MSTTNVRFHALVQTTAALNTDRYIGRIGYDSTKARWVVSPDGATWAESARRDVAETFAVSITSPSIIASTALRIAALNGMLAQTAGGDVRTATASDLPSHASRHENGGADALAGQSIPGLQTTDTPRWYSVNAARAASDGVGSGPFLRVMDDWASPTKQWIAQLGTGSNLALWNYSSSTWTLRWNFLSDGTFRQGANDRITAAGGGIFADLNVVGAIQQNSVDAITSAREGRFTGLRLSNFTSGQIPVASDANGQITASGETDDGTYFTTNRTFRAWNTLTKSGQLWTALQWTQSAEERVSILSSDASGVGGYHSMVLVPWDSDTADRGLGNIDWAQRVSGKSGTNPGLKVAMSGRSAGAGGSVGGYGGQWCLEYRPDNGANLVNAMRVGCFGGSTPDAVQAGILLRAMSGFDSTGVAKFGKFSLGNYLCSGVTNGDLLIVSGASRGDSGYASELYLNTYEATLKCGQFGFSTDGAYSYIDQAKFRNAMYSAKTNRTGSATTQWNDGPTIYYTGTGGHTETLPPATGSGQIIIYTHTGTGTWTLQRQGSDTIRDGGIPTVTSIAIFANASVTSRILMDVSSGLWVRLN